MKAMSSLPELPKELVHIGATTYSGLLVGLLTDAEMKKRYPKIIKDVRGNAIEPVEMFLI